VSRGKAIQARLHAMHIHSRFQPGCFHHPLLAEG
jgi:hypothetical protein